MKKLIVFFSLTLFLSSCVNEILETVDKVKNTDGVVWNPSIALPLVYSDISLRDFMDEIGGLSFLKIEDDGGLTIVYENEYQSKTAEEMISLPDQAYTRSYTLSATEIADLNTNGSLTLNYTEELDYNFGSSEIDRILYKGGSANFTITTSLKHDVKATITLNNGVNNGVPLASVLQATYTSGTNTASDNINLDGYNVDYTKTAAGTSQIEAQVSFTITKGANPILVDETVNFTLNIVDQKFKEIVGFLGAIDFSNEVDTLELSFFNNPNQGSFTLADPRIKMTFSNSFGVPLNAQVTQFAGFSPQNTRFDLTGVPNSLPLPNLSMAELGLSKRSILELNKNTSNLAAFVNNQPAKIVYEFKVEANPSGPSVRNWFTDKSRLGASIEIEVPLHGTAKDFKIEVDQPFEFAVENVEQIEEVLMRIYTENRFPLGISLQAYFRDSTLNTTIDSLIGSDQLLLAAAAVDANGVVTAPSPNLLDISLTGDKAERIRDANQIRMVIRLNTTTIGANQPDVRFMLDNSVLIQLGVQATAYLNQKF